MFFALSTLFAFFFPFSQATCDLSIEWSAANLVFNSTSTWTTPAHQNPWGYVSFDLQNSVLNWSTPCHAYSSRINDYFYGDMWYPCSSGLNSSTLAGETWFRYNRATDLLELNQTWTCSSIQLRAYGNTTQPLDCTRAECYYPDWKVKGGIYKMDKTECDEIDAMVYPSLIQALPLGRH